MGMLARAGLVARPQRPPESHQGSACRDQPRKAPALSASHSAALVSMAVLDWLQCRVLCSGWRYQMRALTRTAVLYGGALPEMCHRNQAVHYIDVRCALQAFTTDVSSSSACRTVGQRILSDCPTARPALARDGKRLGGRSHIDDARSDLVGTRTPRHPAG